MIKYKILSNTHTLTLEWCVCMYVCMIPRCMANQKIMPTGNENTKKKKKIFFYTQNTNNSYKHIFTAIITEKQRKNEKM